MEECSDEEIDPEEWEKVGEEYVVMDLVGMVDKECLKTCDKNRIKLIGMLDAEKPVLQLDDSIYVGNREDAPGTCVLFRTEEKTEGGDSDSDEENLKHEEFEKNQAQKFEVQFHCCTQKKLVMNQTFLSSRQEKD